MRDVEGEGLSVVTVHSSQASTSHFCRLRYTAGIAPSMRRAQPQRSGVRDATVGQNNVALHIAITERSTMDRSPSHLFLAVNLPRFPRTSQHSAPIALSFRSYFL